MKNEDLQKLKFILEDFENQTTNVQEYPINKLKEYVDAFQNEVLNKDSLIEKVYEAWENNNNQKNDYQKMLVKNQIIDYIKGNNKEFKLLIWYFKDNHQPFFIDLLPVDKEEIIYNDTLKSFFNDFPCDYHVLKENISEVEAIILKKQIVYYYHVLGLPLLNYKEMK